MKYLEPTITCLVTSHMKPSLRDELDSLLAQTRVQDLQIIVLDSGAWIGKTDEVSLAMQKIYNQVSLTPIEWYFTGEPANARELYCPVARWTNLAFNFGLIRGKYVCMGYDDDVHYPTYMEKMAGYLDTHPEAMAVRCTQNRAQIAVDGTRTETPPLTADREIPGGENLDCVVDGMQVMMRTSVFEKISYPYLPEDPDHNSCSHSDGIFFNKLSQAIDKLHFIPEALCEHRALPNSTFTPTI